jgi:Rrf2 family protein
MHISALEEYGLRCALQLARMHDNETLAASQIAEKEGISVEYASKLMHLFRKAEMVESVRGMQGGFRLTRPASEVTLKAVLDAVKAKRTPSDSADFCSQFKGAGQYLCPSRGVLGAPGLVCLVFLL